MLSPADAVDTAMSVLVHHLAEAGCLVEPAPPAPAMTVKDAAVLLCRLSGHVRLSEPDVDYKQLLASDAMVTFAWTQALSTGLAPAERTQGEEARRVLLAHHRGI